MGALEGLVVLDATQVMAGPFCAMQLADLGADVIKIEAPGGDPTRYWTGALGTDSPTFNAVNRGKRGIVLNLKQPAAQSVFRRLARLADIVVENYRPGVMAAFGLDYAGLVAGNERLIYASISGYGQTGPDASKGGFDLVAQGVSGIMSITGEPGGPPMKCGVPLTDLGAGLFALAAILAALHHRTRTGRGQYIDTSLVEAGVALSVWEATEHLSGGAIPQPTGSAHRFSAPYQAIRCADGYITLGAANDRLFTRLCGLLGHPEWVERAEFADDSARVRHRVELAALIEAITVAHPRAYWLERLGAHDIPCGPINTYDEVTRDPQIVARNMVVTTNHPVLGRLRTLGSPLKMSDTPTIADRPAPLLGEHTEEVLLGAGYTEPELAALRDAGAIG
ncbi:MAG TPA: CoA transferase [Vicinamibacterales bacterium]|nr:CoA transferase [Vicinamibacterales bacterium]